MTQYRMTLLQHQADELQAALSDADGHERAAYLLCRPASIGSDPWDRTRHQRLLVRRVLPVASHDQVDSSASHVTWHTRSFATALNLAETDSAIVAVVHSHAAGLAAFSVQDDANEPDLLRMAQNRNGPATVLPSLVRTTDGVLLGRAWEGNATHRPIDLISVVGDRYRLHYPGRDMATAPSHLHRQELAFGRGLNVDLRKLRVGIVGCGGTGSAVALLLARLGVGQLVLFDNDVVEETNLNRLHTARRCDADAMLPKVDAAKRTIVELGLGVRVAAINAWIGDAASKDALLACDIVFGCTDDHAGRLLLNRFACYYATPVIDVGLGMELDERESGTFAALDGRVTVLQPGYTCLACREIADSGLAAEEELRRQTPDQYEQRRAERYIIGGGVVNPAVVTFTTEVASMAVNELLHRLTGFRGEGGACSNRVRKFAWCDDLRPGHNPRPGCPICATTANWCKGDTVPFLDRV